MTQQTNLTDIVGLFIFIATMIFSNEVAAVVGPYMVIIIASVVGASFALARRDKSTRVSAILFFVRIVGLAVLLTVGLAAVANAYYPGIEERFLVAPIALLVGFVGDQWPSLLQRVMRTIYAALDLVRGKGGAS